MKKIFILLLVLAVIAAVGAFSQETESSQSIKHSAMVDTVPLFTGIIVSDGDSDLSCFGLAFFYEYNIASHYSIGARFGFYAGKLSDTSYSIIMMSAHGRWYPFSAELEKLFLDVGLGFYTFNVDISGFDRHTDLTLDLKAGYKHMFKNNFYFEPSLGFMLSDAEMASSFSGTGGIGEGLGLFKWHICLGIGMRF